MTTPRDPNTPRNPDQLIDAFLDEGPMDLREQVLDEVRSEVDRTEQRTTFGPWRNLMATRFAGIAAATAVVAGAVIVGLALSSGGPPPGTGPNPSADLGIFAPLAGRIVYEGPDGIAGVDPAAPADPASTVQLTSGAGLPLGWSADGSRLLLFREEQLFVLHADGSETRLTEPLSVFQGATMSPDGSRVVFASGTETPEGEWVDFALYAVAIDGGSAEVLAESQNGFVEAPTFSPDGTQIAYVDGNYDNSHHVWVMDADGTDLREILANESTLQAGHVGALAWSPGGSRIALALGSGIYTFGTDGSDFTRIAGLGHGNGCYSEEECAAELPAEAGSPNWSPDGSQIAYTTGCTEGNGSADTSGCHLAIADADGSNRREFSYGMSGPWHPVTPPPSAAPSEPSPSVSSSSAHDEVMNGFVAARVAGEGAEPYLDLENTRAEGIPLLYATTTGASYERGEFEQVPGVEWPYGWEAFRVRLFAGDTVVEQLIFAGPDTPGLNYQGDGFGTDIPPTTENGQPVAMPYAIFDNEVTFDAAHPWIMTDYSDFGGWNFGRLIPEGPGVPPTTDGGERHDGWDRLFLVADPALGAGCQAGPDAVSAATLAESIRSNPDLGATAPIAVSVGGADALMVDVRIAAGATITVPAGGGGELCANGLLLPVFDQDAVGSEIRTDDGVGTSQATGDWMRLYLFDAPEGSSMRVLAVAIAAPESRFGRAVEAAAPVVDSIQIHAP